MIEFVLVLPILIMLIFSMVDFGNMFITKSSLETTLNTGVELYKEDLRHGDIQSKITDQNVSIVAEFPNATNHSEIEQAFENIINMAS